MSASIIIAAWTTETFLNTRPIISAWSVDKEQNNNDHINHPLILSWFWNLQLERSELTRTSTDNNIYNEYIILFPLALMTRTWLFTAINITMFSNYNYVCTLCWSRTDHGDESWMKENYSNEMPEISPFFPFVSSFFFLGGQKPYPTSNHVYPINPLRYHEKTDGMLTSQ